MAIYSIDPVGPAEQNSTQEDVRNYLQPVRQVPVSGR